MLRLSVFVALFAVALAERVSYQGYQVWRLDVMDENQLEVLAGFAPSAHKYGLQFWKEPRGVNQTVDVMVAPDSMRSFKAFLGKADITHSMMIENVGALVDAEDVHNSAENEDYFAKYHTVQETIDWYTALVKQYSNLATTVKVGTTYKGKDIIAVVISSGGNGTRKALWLDGGIHAREWIAPAVVQYIMNRLLTGYGKDATVTAAVDGLDWYIVPQFNIDGIEYTWTTDRMWRKTISPNKDSRCIGTDPNRNWDYHFGEAGTSFDPCSEAYCGSKAASEIEVSSVAAYLKNNKNIQGYINFHSYSQMWMFPWAYTASLKDKDYDAQNVAALESTKALKAVNGKNFVSGPIATTIYPASGSTVDYTYGTCGIKYSYGVELRDTGAYGFILPANQIIPSGEETLAAVLPLAKAIIADTTLERL